MAYLYPRRVKDLPQLELDSEDDNIYTPRKSPNNGASDENDNNERNKENVDSYNKSSSGYSSIGMYPKRRSELPPLESDSDTDDDNIKGNNLNCAILNDSFLLSPCRSEQDDRSNSRECSASKPKSNDTDNMSFVSKFHKMALQSEKKTATSNPLKSSEATPFQKQHIDNAPLKPLPGIDEQREVPNIVISSVHRTQSDPITKPNDLETPLKPPTKQSLNLPGSACNTSSQFVTPQIRSFSVHRKPRELCISTSQKSRSEMANEFRSQKVLFQTPMTVQRAPPPPNDSLGMSLCDTIPEGIDITSSPEQTPKEKIRIVDTKQLPEKSKKSLEAVFKEIQSENEKEKPKEPIETKETKNGSSSSSHGNNDASNKDSVLNINNCDYLIIKKLGAGGSSSVYLAKRKDTGREYALKVVDLQGDPLIVEGYLNETKLLAQLQGNPCVVALYEYQLLQKESRLLMVMEKGDSDLHKILQGYTSNLPLYVLMNFLYQMIQAVNYIHQNGVIHSDLKPANFLMINGRLKLIDFGIASNIATDSTSIIKFSQAGTFNYISPEALTDTSTGSSPMRTQPKIKISTKSDVWSLGCILYLFLYKKTPFSHIKNIYAKITAITNPSTAIDYPGLPPYYPAMLVHMVRNCLQHNPKQRPSCSDLLKYPFHMVIPIQNLKT